MTGEATYALTRSAILRLLGVVYLVAFLIVVRQGDPLIGHDGLLPADRFLAAIAAETGSRASAFAALPTLFWLDASDRALHAVGWTGLVLSAAVVLGATNALLQLALWALYLSVVQVGQIFYGYGWEVQLLETGFLAVFLCPVRSVRPSAAPSPPVVVIWLFRWLIVRIMWGAGLIKLRGDPCWRDLTCLAWHYETQPIPNPLSWWLHARPLWFHRAGAAFNHFVELLAPFFVVGPRRLRSTAGILFVAFQVTLILSGNLSFLNWLTIVPALACFDDASLAWLLPRALRERALSRAAAIGPPSALHRGAAWTFAAVVALLSIAPVLNLLSPHQAMNRSFDPLHLVNTYGAFGSVGRERDEVILEGTSDDAIGPDTEWREYELPCKPGDVARAPCVISPYHLRLDWQMWFAAMASAGSEPWLLHLAAKLLAGDPGVKALLARDPFPDRPPRYVRAELYRYEFTRPGDGSPDWWRRTYVRSYLRPLSLDDPELRRYLERFDLAGNEKGAGKSPAPFPRLDRRGAR
ncbi:MAG TPA: lipase maturation factor family protein [Candidatus Binatia bacterium]|nr:lipase maturation factor family protein [Candidatus Binatia bacterium]